MDRDTPNKKKTKNVRFGPVLLILLAQSAILATVTLGDSFGGASLRPTCCLGAGETTCASVAFPRGCLRPETCQRVRNDLAEGVWAEGGNINEPFFV
jgi:hypothetical protein